MNGPVLAIVLTVVVHILGAAALVWAMGMDDLRGFFSTGDGRDGGAPVVPDAPVAPRPSGDVPLPDAAPAKVRLRGEQLPLGELRRRAGRRPAHLPDRAPSREPGEPV